MGRADRKKEGKKIPHTRKAKELIPGVNAIGRSRSAYKTHRGMFMEKRKKAGGAGADKKDEKKQVKLEKPKASAVEVKAPKAKAKGTHPKPTEPKWYAAEDVHKPIPSRKNNHKPTVLRKSITPGTILIILAGRFRGKRVVFLKQLPSGLLLVTGPYKYNGVPLRRINQAYVISTSTKINVAAINVHEINDEFFAKAKEKTDKKKPADFLNEKEKKKKVVVSATRKAEQIRVDTALIAEISKTEKPKTVGLKGYLKAKFSLKKGQAPHTLKF